MAQTVRLLEQLVNQAVERLQSLALERDQLEGEVRSLRQRLEELERRGSEATAEGVVGRGWQSQRPHVITVLRRTLAELRGE
jgi:hypothetical protein